MTRKEELKQEIAKIEESLKPLKEELNEIYNKETDDTEERIVLAQQGKGNFTEEELRYAATARCSCGAGFAYPVNIGPMGSWECSNILLGKAIPHTEHSSPMPFAFYEVKSEDQASANGQTTRPIKE